MSGEAGRPSSLSLPDGHMASHLMVHILPGTSLRVNKASALNKIELYVSITVTVCTKLSTFLVAVNPTSVSANDTSSLAIWG